jgi:thioredoxin 1
VLRAFDAPIISNDQSLDRLLAAPIPTLILFWDGKVLPETLSQVMIDLAKKNAGELIIAKINWADNPAAASRFHLSNSITVIGIRKGEEVTRAVSPKAAEISRHVDYLLGRGPLPAAAKEPHPASHRDSHRGSNGHPTAVTDATFEQQVLKSPIPVLVDFWASWCAPCRMVAPVLEQLAKEYSGRLRIVKLNVDENPHFAGRYGVQGIPTMLIIQNGTVVDRIVGAVSKEHLRAKLDTLL